MSSTHHWPKLSFWLVDVTSLLCKSSNFLTLDTPQRPKTAALHLTFKSPRSISDRVCTWTSKLNAADVRIVLSINVASWKTGHCLTLLHQVLFFSIKVLSVMLQWKISSFLLCIYLVCTYFMYFQLSMDMLNFQSWTTVKISSKIYFCV